MSGTSDRYDPRQRLKALLSTVQRNQPRIVSSNVPGLVTEHGEALSTTPVPQPSEGLCVLIDAIQADWGMLPSDFADIPHTRAGLKSHVRPDGGVCLGFFGNGPEDAVVLYGDPAIGRDQAIQLVKAFWQQLAARRAPKIELVQ